MNSFSRSPSPELQGDRPLHEYSSAECELDPTPGFLLSASAMPPKGIAGPPTESTTDSNPSPSVLDLKIACMYLRMRTQSLLVHVPVAKV